MTHTSGPRHDDPHPVPLFYPPGFEPSATNESDDRLIAPASRAAAPPTLRTSVARRPVMAGFLGTALVALIGFSGGLLAAPAVSGLGAHQAGQSASAQAATASGTSAQAAARTTAASSTSALGALAPPPDDGAGD